MHKTHIVLHHSLTKDGLVVDFSAMRRYHMSYRIDGRIVSQEDFERRQANGNGMVFETPWEDIGYHVILERVNGKPLVIFGRMPDERGAHCRELGMNPLGIAMCFVGNYDLEPPPWDLWTKGIQVAQYFCRTYGIATDHVIGHGEAQKADPAVGRALKTCPGLLFNTDLFRENL